MPINGSGLPNHQPPMVKPSVSPPQVTTTPTATAASWKSPNYDIQSLSPPPKSESSELTSETSTTNSNPSGSGGSQPSSTPETSPDRNTSQSKSRPGWKPEYRDSRTETLLLQELVEKERKQQEAIDSLRQKQPNNKSTCANLDSPTTTAAAPITTAAPSPALNRRKNSRSQSVSESWLFPSPASSYFTPEGEEFSLKAAPAGRNSKVSGDNSHGNTSTTGRRRRSSVSGSPIMDPRSINSSGFETAANGSGTDGSNNDKAAIDIPTPKANKIAHHNPNLAHPIKIIESSAPIASSPPRSSSLTSSTKDSSIPPDTVVTTPLPPTDPPPPPATVSNGKEFKRSSLSPKSPHSPQSSPPPTQTQFTSSQTNRTSGTGLTSSPKMEGLTPPVSPTVGRKTLSNSQSQSRDTTPTASRPTSQPPSRPPSTYNNFLSSSASSRILQSKRFSGTSDPVSPPRHSRTLSNSSARGALSNSSASGVAASTSAQPPQDVVVIRDYAYDTADPRYHGQKNGEDLSSSKRWSQASGRVPDPLFEEDDDEGRGVGAFASSGGSGKKGKGIGGLGLNVSGNSGSSGRFSFGFSPTGSNWDEEEDDRGVFEFGYDSAGSGIAGAGIAGGGATAGTAGNGIDGNEIVQGLVYKAAFDFQPEGPSEMEMRRGNFVKVIELVCEGWVVAERIQQEDEDEVEGRADAGLVPANYLESM